MYIIQIIIPNLYYILESFRQLNKVSCLKTGVYILLLCLYTSITISMHMLVNIFISVLKYSYVCQYIYGDVSRQLHKEFQQVSDKYILQYALLIFSFFDGDSICVYPDPDFDLRF